MRYHFVCLLFFIAPTAYSQSHFIHTQKIKFYQHRQEYKFIGVNYWYGGFLASSSQEEKQRLTSELDFLKKNGVSNLRVMLSSEGDSAYPYRIYPSLQEKPYQYNETLLRGFDYFVYQASIRHMNIVFVLNNNWEWSGGFGQYLEWAGYNNPILPKTENWDWDKYCEYIAQFYSCDSCQTRYMAWIKKVIERKNTITKKQYKDDPTIMAWELANEPRPMRPKAIDPYKQWIKSTSQYIKSIDKNHLVTIGVEGIIGTLMDTNLFKEIHNYPSIDYATIHIWPKTWRWYNGDSDHSTSDTTLQKTKAYIELHSRLCQSITKPLVIEEFGLHRDGNLFSENSSTNHRDKYFRFILDMGRENDITGFNFWGAFGYRDKKLKGDFWHRGLPYSADPPQEEQGLYGVFKTDKSTWESIKNYKKVKEPTK